MVVESLGKDNLYDIERPKHDKDRLTDVSTVEGLVSPLGVASSKS